MSNPTPTPPTHTEAPSPPAAKPRGGGRCCLAGCGTMLVLGLVLAVAGWWAYRSMALPWWTDQVEEWKARLPIPLDELSVAEILAPPSEEPFDPQPGGTTDPADFPDDIFLPPDPLQAAFRSYEREAMGMLVVAADDPAALEADISRAMHACGWQPVAVDPADDGTSLVFSKEDRRTTYTLIPRRSAIEVWIESQKVHQE